ncbi:hypothetical protein D9611_008967 [Ephemerocybe angulata]|uniref:Protein kinase domain-containing protein n=1 Tax=Ephemerocybe angulata TaxID=980116 RepID=A0A8H5BYE0_9AGAR|nr:hypothetical protein D9611_008967 [Tulosesus angulatus]
MHMRVVNCLAPYDVHENRLDEIKQAPEIRIPLLQGLEDWQQSDPSRVSIDDVTSKKLSHVEEVFTCLEEDVLVMMQAILKQLEDGSSSTHHSDSTIPTSQSSIPAFYSLSLNHLSKLRRFLIFLRFRNSGGYASIVRKLSSDLEPRKEDGNIYPAYKTLVVQMQRRYVLRAFMDFLQGQDRRESQKRHEDLPTFGSSSGDGEDKFVDFFHEIMDCYCWRMVEAELCVGVVRDERETGKEEYILPESCYGSLDEGYEEDPDSCDFFFPISPTVAIYLLGTSPTTAPPPLLNPHTLVSIPVGLESMIDVHLRNSMVLQTYPARLIFASLKCIVCSLKSYDEFRWINEHQDYSRLRMRCRQKYSKEELVKTLVLRDREDSPSDSEDDVEDELEAETPTSKKAVRVFDLTDQVRLEGTWAVGFGTFSDVWKGTWRDPMERRERAVAVKFLRSVMVQNVKERLIRRIQAEVSTWHKLCHRNVSQFFGIVQSASSFGMVSPWYSNGIICDYLKMRPNVDRLKLLTQIASGVMHLHSHVPPIVHGDLKGGNILVDAHGYAIITDFGLSKVMEEVSQACSELENAPPGTACGGRGTSVFAGSTRWMAPELILALVNEVEGERPIITTMSDVYAFGSVCLEVATDDVPYPHRTNDHAVILDILRTIPPRRADSSCKVDVRSSEEFWAWLDLCWAVPAERRPSMMECLRALEDMVPTVAPASQTAGPYSSMTTSYTRRRSS